MDKDMIPISQWPIYRTRDGYYRLVNHDDRLLTNGCANETEVSIARENIILVERFEANVERMRNAYNQEFGAQKSQCQHNFHEWPGEVRRLNSIQSSL